ncbi:MAG: hypothetical protein IJN94_04395 [Clostridia bacterium]|nr:hypothetical protein [Clostridia bacterium]
MQDAPAPEKIPKNAKINTANGDPTADKPKINSSITNVSNKTSSNENIAINPLLLLVEI